MVVETNRCDNNVLITLNTYSHVLPSLHERAMDELSNLFTHDEGEEGEKGNEGIERRTK